ncbi:hypothetical protein QFC19_001135 [Naganishia cerealis]|uniref:Uncharacterized protein n=1 Tax=Naganishia cerealis TaxID=610337 RepID=A0ACC2WI92_9TREE|nr:hypothetical protein QFC19_001135 [Naganishia cerealis]
MYDLLAIALQKETAEALLTQDVHRRLTTQLESFESPRLVVALEYDHWTSGGGGQEWRELGLARGMQFVQWTMMAQPGHPVLLDTLSRIIKDVEINRVRDSPSHGTNGEEGESENRDRLLEVLDFTGPGVFSDAVFRYLLARWGVHPRDISGSSGPIRIGDVL